MQTILTVHLILSLLGGGIAVYKKDYFTRGFFIAFFTSIFGILAMALSADSDDRGNNEDGLKWPRFGGFAILATIVSALILFLIK